MDLVNKCHDYGLGLITPNILNSMLCLYFYSATDILATVTPIGVKFCMMVVVYDTIR